MISPEQDWESSNYFDTAVAVGVVFAVILLIWTLCSDVVTLWLWQIGWL